MLLGMLNEVVGSAMLVPLKDGECSVSIVNDPFGLDVTVSLRIGKA